MKWYTLANKTIRRNIEVEFGTWKWTHENEDEMIEKFNDKQIQIAEREGFELLMKTTYLYIFSNERKHLLISWHNDHDASWTFEEEGFDSSNDDLSYYISEGMLSKEDLIDLFFELNNIDQLTEKQQQALNNICEYCKDPDQYDKYDQKPYSKNEYQNIYHNIWNNKKLKQKIKVRDLLEDIDFF